jgi:hypothetical protein
VVSWMTPAVSWMTPAVRRMTPAMSTEDDTSCE